MATYQYSLIIQDRQKQKIAAKTNYEDSEFTKRVHGGFQ